METGSDRAEDAGPEHARFGNARHLDREARRVGLDLRPCRVRSGAPRETEAPHLHVGGDDRLRHVADSECRSFENGPDEITATVLETQAGEHAASLVVPD